MILGGCAEGTRVIIYCFKQNVSGQILLSSVATSLTMYATILQQHAPYTTTLGWRQDEECPEMPPNASPLIMDLNWIKDGFIVAQEYGNHCECKLVAAASSSTVSTRQEAPCQNCGRMNDVGVSKCWLCECAI